MSGRSKPERPPQYKTGKQWINALLKMGKTPQEIRQITGLAKSYVWRLYGEYEKRKGRPEETKVEVKEVTKEVPEEIEEIEELPSGREGVEAIGREVIAEGKLTERNCVALFHCVNDLFPEKHRRPSDAMDMLGRLWCDPLNRILAKYFEENIDLIVSIVATIIVFAPAIKGTITEWRQAREAKKKKKEGEKPE